MNFEMDRNLIWIIGFALIAFALSNKSAFAGGLFGPQAVNTGYGQETESDYIYRRKRSTRERRCL